MATEQELERLVVRLTGDGSSYMKMMDDAEKAANKLSDGLESKNLRMKAFRDGLKGYAGQVAGTLTGMVGGLGFLNSITTGVKLAAEAEKMESDFGVMLKSVEKGKKLVAELQTFAAQTPLGMGDLTQASKTLLQFGVSGKDVIPTMKMLGDVALGDAFKLQRLSLAFGQLKATGRAQGDEINQMIEAGFNPLMEISRTTGESVESLRGKMQKGLITFDMIANAFRTATSAGGNFVDGMQKASVTLDGLFSTLMDDFAAFQRSIGQQVVEALRLKDVVKALSGVMQWLGDTFKAIPDWIKRIVIIGGALLAFLGLLGIVGPAVASAFTMAWGAITAALSAVASVGWPLIALFVAIGTIVWALVQRAGGVEAVWTMIVGKLQEFWEWLKPVRQAVESLFNAVVEYAQWAWGLVVYWVGWAYDKIVETLGAAWAWVEQQTGFTFGNLRDTIRDTFLFAEFTLRNFGLVWEVAWAGLKYYAVAALNWILKNFVLILGAPVLLPIYLAMQVNWEKLWKNMATFAVSAMLKILEFANKFPGQFMKILQGGGKALGKFIAGVWEDMGKAFEGTKFTWKGVEIPALDRLEEQLRQEFEEKKGALNQSWEEFKKQKLEEFAKENKGATPEEQGEEDGKKYGQGMSKGLKGTEAVLFASAEALSRRFEQLERMKEAREMNSKASGGAPGSVAGANLNFRQQEQQTDLLKKIAENTKTTANKDATGVEPANL